MAKPKFNKNDILVFPDGEIVQVFEVDYPAKGMTAVQRVDRDETSFLPTNSMEDAVNLHNDPVQLSLFNLTRSIHLRLNRMSKV